MSKQEFKVMELSKEQVELRVNQILDESELSKKQGSTSFLPWRVARVAAAVLCGLIVLAGGTVAVDAATDGAVRKLFGFGDSIGIGADKTEFVQMEGDSNSRSLVVSAVIGAEGMGSTTISSTEDEPVFSCWINISEWEHLQTVSSLGYCNTKEDYAWTVYERLETMVHAYKEDEKKCAVIIKELERVKEEIGTGTELQDGCAMGVQFLIDDLYAKEGKNIKVLALIAIDYEDVDGDGVRAEAIGESYIKVDTDAWEKESEETGTMEFEVEAMGGVPRKYLVKVKEYKPSFSYTWTMVE